MSLVARFRFDSTTKFDFECDYVHTFRLLTKIKWKKRKWVKGKVDWTTANNIFRFFFQILGALYHISFFWSFFFYRIVTKYVSKQRSSVLIYGQFSTLFYGCYLFLCVFQNTRNRFESEQYLCVVYFRMPTFVSGCRFYFFTINFNIEFNSRMAHVHVYVLCAYNVLWLLIYIISLNNMGYILYINIVYTFVCLHVQLRSIHCVFYVRKREKYDMKK